MKLSGKPLASGVIVRQDVCQESTVKTLHPACKRQVLDCIKNDPIEAVRIMSGGAVILEKHGTDNKGVEYYDSQVLYNCYGATQKGSSLRFWLNVSSNRRPGFACGSGGKGSFLKLVMQAQTLDSKEEAWEFCWRHLPLREMGPGKVTSWTFEHAEQEWKKGLDNHKCKADVVKPLFSIHIAELSDSVRVKNYPVTKGEKSILASYYSLSGERVWMQERDLKPYPDGRYRNWSRLIEYAPPPPGKVRGKAKCGLYPRLKDAWKDIAIITVEAWEADQLIEQGADAYAVPTVRMSVPEEMLRWLAEKHSGGLLFLGPSGEAGEKWALQRVGQCRNLGIIAEAFLWPKEVKAGYTVSKIMREGGKVSVDAQGKIEIECASGALKAAVQEGQRTFMMISSIIQGAPGSIISMAAKVIYGHLLDQERKSGKRGVRIHYDDLMFVTNIGENQIVKALKDLQKWDLIGRIGRGLYQVRTLNEIPQSTLDKLERASEEWQEARRKSKSTAQILSIRPSVQDDVEEAF